MSVTIQTRNTLDQTAPYSYTSSGVAVGVGTVGVKNLNSYATNDAVQIGQTGEEQAEIGLISSLSGTALVLSGTLKYSHPQDTPVYNISFDKLIFKVSTVGTAGTATAITSGTVAITPDSEYTQFSHSTGASTYAYKTSYYNSLSAAESADSDWITPAGYQPYQLASIRQRVKNKLFDANFFKTDDSVDEWINEWVEELNNSAIQVNQSYSLGSTSVTFGTAGLGTITASDYKEIKRLWITFDGVNTMKAGHIDITGFWPEDNFNAMHPYYYNNGDNVIGIKPPQSGGTASIVYSKIQPKLVNDTDELPVSMKAYSKSFVDYCLGEAYLLDNQKPRGDEYHMRAEQAQAKFVNQITPRGKDGIIMMDLDFPVNESDYDLFI